MRKRIAIGLFCCIFLACSPVQHTPPRETSPDLKSAPPKTDWAPLLRAMDSRHGGDPEILAQAISSKGWAAALAVRSIGQWGPDAPLELLAFNPEDDSELRAEKAFSLGLVGSDEARKILTANLQDQNSVVRAAVVRALGVGGDEKSDELLISHMKKEQNDLVVSSFLWNFNRAIPDSHQTWAISFMKRWSALGDSMLEAVLYHGGRGKDPSVDQVADRSLDNENVSVQVNLLRILARREKPDPVQVTWIQSKLMSDSPRVRIAAVRALAGGPGLEEAAKMSLPQWPLFDRHPQVVSEALSGLTRRPQPDSVSALLDIQRNGLKAHQSEALGALAALEKAIPNAVPEFASLVGFHLSSNQYHILRAAFEASPVLGEKGKALMEKRFYHRGSVLQSAWLQGYLAFENPDYQIVVDLLNSTDGVTRALAVDALLEKDFDKYLDLVLEAAAKDLEPTSDLRATVLDHAAKHLEDPRFLRYTMDSLTADPDWALRRKAREILRKDAPDHFGEAPAPVANEELVLLAADLVDREVRVVLKLDRGEMELTLFPRQAPMTVANFINLVQQDYFDGLQFHRVVPDFVVQDGCPRGDGWGGPGHSLRCELNPLPYRRGTVGMALSGRDTGGSQWFATLTDMPHLVGGYTIFGEVTKGLDLLEKQLVGGTIHSAQVFLSPEMQ